MPDGDGGPSPDGAPGRDTEAHVPTARPRDGRPRLTVRSRHGERGEALASRHLEGLGWWILARRVRVGRDEIDLVAVEPGPPDVLVFVEVRSHATSRFGAPEESVDRRKIARLYRAASTLGLGGTLPDGTRLPRLPWRIDLVAVDDAPSLGLGLGGPAIRHVRSVEPL